MSSTGHVHRREKFLWWQFHTPPSAVHQRPFSIFSSVSLPNHQRVFLPLRHPRPETSALCERTADFRLTFSTAGFFSLPKAPPLLEGVVSSKGSSIAAFPRFLLPSLRYYPSNVAFFLFFLHHLFFLFFSSPLLPSLFSFVSCSSLAVEIVEQRRRVKCQIFREHFPLLFFFLRTISLEEKLYVGEGLSLRTI